jgi:hypothetical protein
MKPGLRLVLVASLSLLIPAGAHAQSSFKMQPIAKLGDRVGDTPLLVTNGYLHVGALNDNDEIIFSAADTDDSEALIQYAGGKLTTLAARGMDGPNGKWPQNVRFMPSVSMNQLGDAVFGAGMIFGTTLDFQTFRWDHQTRQVFPVAPTGTPAINGLTFWGSGLIPVINNHNDIAFVAGVGYRPRTPPQGVFFLGGDGQLRPVAIPGQPLPDGRRIAEAFNPDINDAGLVAFMARGTTDSATTWSAYVWDHGVITPVVLAGTTRTPGPGGALVATVWSVWLNQANHDVLLEASLNSANDPVGLYLFSGGQLKQVAVPGQEMPGQGTLQFETGPSYGNNKGQHAFLGVLQDGLTAAYLIDAEGRLSLLLKSGLVTNIQGPGIASPIYLTNVGEGAEGGSFGVALNNKGEVALTVSINGGADTLVLLTPAGP